ncbi:ANXA7_11 [Acanthosepion pharaonis]|uniref:Annexin n=1 Tax=Acanthosepion pharaonis TaxID=158019 RepID=A0A812BBM3_ACAPH|nr:ANXA7_11 [Sepia pharaonis]
MHGTVFPKDDFDCEAACRTLKEAMDGLGTNESDIITVLTSHSNAQRQEIKEQYKQLFGEDLIDDLKSELGGDFEDVCLALLDPPRVYDAHELHRAISGAGTSENPLIEIMVTRTNEELEEIKEIYRTEYEVELEDDLKSDTSGYFRRMLVSLCTASRDEGWWADPELAASDAQRIYDAGEGQAGTDECEINSVLCQRTLPQLQATLVAYQELTGNDLRESIESETSGSVQEGYLAILDAAIDLRKYFAKCIYNSMAGFGTSDSDLIRLIVSRSEVDLEVVKHIFQEMYEKSLAEWVSDECSGDYKRILLAVID